MGLLYFAGVSFSGQQVDLELVVVGLHASQFLNDCSPDGLVGLAFHAFPLIQWMILALEYFR